MKAKLAEEDKAAVATILMEQLEVAPEQITPDARLRDDLGADSLDIAEIVMQIEDYFGVTMDDDDASDEVTVGRIYAALERLLGQLPKAGLSRDEGA
jgi:acyl carrier protein